MLVVNHFSRLSKPASACWINDLFTFAGPALSRQLPNNSIFIFEILGVVLSIFCKLLTTIECYSLSHNSALVDSIYNAIKDAIAIIVKIQRRGLVK